MSFSSRTPRTHRNRVISTRTRTRRPAPPARHLRLWEAIRQTRKELSHWQQRADQVDTLFRQHILPRETRLTTACSSLTDRLMDSYEEGSQTVARQALLALWIADNLRSLLSHPFVSQAQCSALAQRWQDIQVEESNRADGRGTNPARTPAGSLADALEDDELDDDDVVFDFGWHHSGASARKSGDDTLHGDHEPESGLHEDKIHHDRDDETTRSSDDGPAQADDDSADATLDVDTRVSELEKRLSVDRLFRQLARVLHPDLEQDEALKAEKHDLMSQCLQARQDKDINTLLTLYCEHVGDLPEDLSETDHEELISALQMQLRQLQNELRQQRFSDPLHVQIVERYSTGDEQQTLKRIMHHAQSLDSEAEQLETLRQNLDSEDLLEDALDARREIELDRMVIDQMTGYS